MNSVSDRPPVVVFFGTYSILTYVPLRVLIESGVQIAAIIVPVSPLLRNRVTVVDISSQIPIGSDSRVPGAADGDSQGELVPLIAQQYHIPLLEVGRLPASETVEMLAAFAADFFCVSCFPWRIPSDLLALPSQSALNVHPSLLPANRGPDPLFWAFRNGDDEAGVTVHRMNEAFDGGDIAMQEAIPLKDGITEASLRRSCADAGGRLLLESINRIVQGHIAWTTQDASRVTYFPTPTAAQSIVTECWDCRSAYNFICGTVARLGYVELCFGGVRYRARKAYGWHQGGTQQEISVTCGSKLSLMCSDGVLLVSI